MKEKIVQCLAIDSPASICVKFKLQYPLFPSQGSELAKCSFLLPLPYGWFYNSDFYSSHTKKSKRHQLTLQKTFTNLPKLLKQFESIKLLFLYMGMEVICKIKKPE